MGQACTQGRDDPPDVESLLRELGGDTRLAEDLGLSSLEVIEAVFEVDERLMSGGDGLAVTDIATVEDLCRLCQDALRDAPAGPSLDAGDDELDRSVGRARERKRRRDTKL